MFFPGKPSHPSLMFVGKAPYPSEAAFRWSTLGKAPANIRLVWKGPPRTNTLGYYEHF